MPSGRTLRLSWVALLVAACSGGSNATGTTGADGGGGDASDAAMTSDGTTNGDGAGEAGSDSGAPDDDAPFAEMRATCTFKKGALPKDTFGPSIANLQIPIDTLVIVSEENRAWDHYFARLPQYGQSDVDVESPGLSLVNTQGKAFSPFHQADYCFGDTKHDWDSMHLDWDNGKNDGFVKVNDPGGERTLGWFDQTDLAFYYDMASTYGIGDKYFSALLGPTGPNRLYLYAGTSSGHIANGPGVAAGQPSIFKRLSDAKVAFGVYSYSSQQAGNCPGPYSFETSIFCGDIPQGAKTGAQFEADAAAGKLPNVVWLYASVGEHPPEDPQLGEQKVQHVFNVLAASPQWARAAFFDTYDEGGGIYDHVAPAKACAPDATPPAIPAEGSQPGDFKTYGFRVPMIIASPWSRPHYVSHQVTSHTSLLRFIELRFGLPSVSDRDANEWPLLDYFDFTKPNFATPHVPPDVVVTDPKTKGC
jgi:phospholipase C